MVVVKSMNDNRATTNKLNALKSSGPKSETGKSRSRLNALKHGAYSVVCLEGEDINRFKMLLLDLLAHYKPVGFEENLIVKEIAETIWRKNRFKSAEALALHSYRVAESEREETAGDVGFAMSQDAAAYGTVPRCLAAENLLDKRLWSLFDRLRKIQKKRGVDPWKPITDRAEKHTLQVGQVHKMSLQTPPEHGSSQTNKLRQAKCDESTHT